MTRIALFSLAFLAACDVGNFAPDRNGGGDAFEFGNSNTTGFLRGDLATVQNFDDELALGSTQIGPNWSYMELHVDGPYGWAMIGVNLQGELGQGNLAPGNSLTITSFSGDISPEDGDTIDGDVIGCSGPDTWNAETDEPAQEATISISENPDTGDLEVVVVADFGDNGVVTGGGSVSTDVNPR